MKNLLVCVSVTFLALIWPSSSSATPLFNLQATSQYPSNYSDFELVFNDIDNDSFFSRDEFVAGSFTGMTELVGGLTFDVFFNVPEIPGVADGDPAMGGLWQFNRSADSSFIAVNYSNWRYTAKVVPEPATMLLFGAGLAGFGVFRKKFRKT